MSKLRRWCLSALGLVGLTGGLVVTVGTAAQPAAAQCVPRILVLSAMPLEIDPILAQATIDNTPPVVLNGRYFVTGMLAGNRVIMGITGIGPADAQATTAAAFNYFSCEGNAGISGVVFSGTSGGDYIGDVFVPSAWTQDGKNFFSTDTSMFNAAESAASGVKLEKTTPTGDPFCVCALADGITTPITVQHTPTVELGGNGLTTDPVGGQAVPCSPPGSDLLSCTPCRELDHSVLSQTVGLAQGALPFVEDPTFFESFLTGTTPPGTYVSSDEETAVVAAIAAAHSKPFIGFRAASDGPGNTPGTGGDPLMLPGFPFQFLVYRQLAADNAAAMTVAFLGKWAGQG